MIQATQETFEQEVINSQLPVIVDFWAPWCGPCQILAPIMDQIAQDLSGKAKVVKVNVDENPQLAQTYQVVSIPTVILFQNGQPQKTLIGLQSKQAYLNLVNAG